MDTTIPRSVVVEEWWPHNPPIYDINLSYADNVEKGPFMFGKPIPDRIWKPKEEWLDFLNHKVASPLGVPAGPLLTSKWIELAAQLGFDVVTYKTIRSSEFAGHPLPNVIYVDGDQVTNSLLQTEKQLHTAFSSDIIPKQMANLAITNSFGMPSLSREFLMHDIPKANESLQEGQVMIVSVVGSASTSVCGAPASGNQDSAASFIRDFVETAQFAKQCGAKIVEANFSCPNVTTGQGSLYQNADTVFDIASVIASALGDDCPLILKVGTYRDTEIMKDVFAAASRAKVKGICGINSVSMQVSSPSTKEAALGASRLTSGVCGGPIRPIAIDFVKKANDVIKKNSLPLTLIGCGGITEAHHFKEFLDSGAQVAMSATGMMWDPYLAARYHHSFANK